MKAKRVFPWLLAVVLASVTHAAIAKPGRFLNPSTAEADARGLIESHGYSFCTKPDDPLPLSARDLCPLATRAPACAPLAAACSKAPEPPPPELSEFWERVLRTLAQVAPYAAWALIAVLFAIVAYLVQRALRASRDEAMPSVVLPRSDVSILLEEPLAVHLNGAEALLQRAREAHLRGDAKTALFTYLAAALRALDERGAIRLAKERTNGEYVRACQELPSRPGLREIVREVDAVQFGGGGATEPAVAIARARATQIVRAHATSVATLVVGLMALASIVTLAACDDHLGAHGNPAGMELLVELLEKQGADLATLPASLANLPMQGAKGPAVILDLERVPLEAGTQAHLVAWVKQGGTLVIAGNPARWPSELWAKPLVGNDRPEDSAEGVTVRVETRDAPGGADDDPRHPPPRRRGPPPTVHRAVLARRAAMTWPSEDRAPRVIAKLADGELYAALHTFGDGKVLGLANGDLLTNLGLAVPGNAAALVALLGALDQREFAIARSEQGITPPTNPFAGLLRIGLGPALVHVALFLPILFLAFGTRQAGPASEPPTGRRAFAEHILAVGGLYARQRVAKHALAVYARHVDERARAAMGRGTEPALFLAARAEVDKTFTAGLYARALVAQGNGPPRGDELVDLQRLTTLFTKAMRRG